MKPSISLDDPRLTAYALGELSDEEDRLLIESAIENTPELQSFVDDIRELSTTLKQEFQAEALPEPAHEMTIVEKRSPWRYLTPLGLAACLALMLTWLPQRLNFRAEETSLTVLESSGPGKKEHAAPSVRQTPRPEPFTAIQPDKAPLLATNDDLTSGIAPGSFAAGEHEEKPISLSDSVSTGPQAPSNASSASITPTPAPSPPPAGIPNSDLSSMIASVEESDADGAVQAFSLDLLSAGGVIHHATAPTPTPLSSAPESLSYAQTELSKKALVSDAATRGVGGRRASLASISVPGEPMSGNGFGGSPRGGERKDRLGPPNEIGTESYANTVDQPFRKIVNPGDERTTFSTDVDTASYSNIRRFLTGGQRPPRDAVRVEEMINYFHYAYPNPAEDEEKPFSVNLEVNEAPWSAGHRLLRIGLKARDVQVDKRPDSNLVFLVDVSGSMSPYNKLPLLKTVLQAMVKGLTERDMVSIIVYAGESRVHLEPTPGSETSRLIASIDQLKSGGSTNGESGIQLAYELASKHRLANGVNRVLLATDGDFNVGTTNTNQLIAMAKSRAKEDQIFLTVLGFGEGNVKDDRMEQLADQVDGSYHYIDSEREGRKVLIDEMSATLVPMAKDVKVQVEFNPAKVSSYRLIGYANRMLANRDFADDKKDAGEMGAGHRVTAFYEIVPTGARVTGEADSPLKYRPQAEVDSNPEPNPDFAPSDDLVTVRLRYKDPKSDTSQLMETTLIDDGTIWVQASEDFRFASSVAAFGMHLRSSPHCRASLEQILEWADGARTLDEYGWRAEFVDLVRRAGALR